MIVQKMSTFLGNTTSAPYSHDLFSLQAWSTPLYSKQVKQSIDAL